jgi:hypothetical protein
MSNRLGILTDIYYKSYIRSTKVDTLVDDNTDYMIYKARGKEEETRRWTNI